MRIEQQCGRAATAVHSELEVKPCMRCVCGSGHVVCFLPLGLGAVEELEADNWWLSMRAESCRREPALRCRQRFHCVAACCSILLDLLFPHLLCGRYRAGGVHHGYTGSLAVSLFLCGHVVDMLDMLGRCAAEHVWHW